MSKKLTRIVVTLLVLVTLTAGAAQAAPWSTDRSERSPFAGLWDWMISWFQASTVEEGCGMDPDGRCRSGETPDEGPHMDPDG